MALPQACAFIAHRTGFRLRGRHVPRFI